MQAPVFFSYYLICIIVVVVIGYINPRVEKSEEVRARDWLYSHENLTMPVIIFITRRVGMMALFRITIVLEVICAMLFFLEPENVDYLRFWGMNPAPPIVSVLLAIVLFVSGWFIMFMLLNLADSIQAMQLRKYYIRKYGVIVEDLIPE